jgi:protein O-GlcNAc transferase
MSRDGNVRRSHRSWRAVTLLCLLFLIASRGLPANALDTVYTLTTNGPESMEEGSKLFEEGNYDQAALYFWRAVLFQEKHSNEYTVEDAYSQFMNCFAIQGRTADGFVFIAMESMQRNQPKMAGQYVEQALSIDPAHPEALALKDKLEGTTTQTRSVNHNSDSTSFKKRDNKFQPRYGTAEADNPLEGKTPEDLYEYGSTLFSRRNYEHCADMFELSCLRSNLHLGPSCSNAVYCRMMIMDWGFNGTGFNEDMERLQRITEQEVALYRRGSFEDFAWNRAASVHPHMMLGYPLPPLLKRYVAESVAFMDEAMARVSTSGSLNPLPADMPFEHVSRRIDYITEAANPGFKLKVGFVSSGFNSKAVLYLSQDVFRFYDRSKIEMHIFSLGPPDNHNFISVGMRGVDWRKRVANNVDYFHDIEKLKGSHIDMARYIHERGIHILIEWDGYARQGERAQGLMALRPAPVQILHQEYLGTSGAKYVDYIFTDKTTSPPETAKLYTEKFIYLPNHFFSKGHAVQSEVVPPRHMYEPQKVPYQIGYGSPQENRCMAKGIAKPTFVFCNFNKFLKNNPETMRSWLRILKETPGSILCLLENPQTGLNYLKRFVHEATGEPTVFKNPATGKEQPDFLPRDGEELNKRIFFLPWERNPFDHQQRNHDFCNIMLDSHPYNGHTVAQDALYAGVPIVTRSDGEDMSSRVTTSANKVLGLEELNAYHGARQYEDIAIELGTNESKYHDIRTRLVNTALQHNPMHPYWDAPRYTRNLESGLFQAWDRFLSGLAPGEITVVESDETARGTYDDYLEAHPSDRPNDAHDEL